MFSQKNLNLCQRWIEFMADYNFHLHCHWGKANVVVDVMSRKSVSHLGGVAI